MSPSPAPRRFLIVRREMDGTERAVFTISGRQRDYDFRPLADAVARGFGPEFMVRDRYAKDPTI